MFSRCKIKFLSTFLIFFLIVIFSFFSHSYALNPHLYTYAKTYPDLCFVVGESETQQAPPFLRASNFKPGDVAEGFLILKNCGRKASTTLTIALSYSNFADPKGDSSAEGFLAVMKIEEISIGERRQLLWNKLSSEIEDLNGNGYADLHDLTLSQLSVRYAIPPNETRELYMRIKFIPEAGNEFQGDRINLTFTFTIGG